MAQRAACSGAQRGPLGALPRCATSDSPAPRCPSKRVAPALLEQLAQQGQLAGAPLQRRKRAKGGKPPLPRESSQRARRALLLALGLARGRGSSAKLGAALALAWLESLALAQGLAREAAWPSLEQRCRGARSEPEQPPALQPAQLQAAASFDKA